MAAISFRLDSVNTRKAEQPVMCRYSHKPTGGNATNYVTTTGVSVLPEQWKNGKVVNHPNAPAENRKLNLVRERLEYAIANVTTKGDEPLAALVKSEYKRLLVSLASIEASGGFEAIDETYNQIELSDIKLLENKITEHKDQIKLWESQIEEIKRKRNEWVDDILINYILKFTTRKGINTLEDSTIRAYKSIANSFNEFLPNCKVINITDKVLYQFQDYLIAKGTLNSSIENYISKIKGVLNYYKGEIEVNPLYSRYSFDLPTKQDNVIALEETDLQAIAELHFDRKKNGTLSGHERARDLLLLMASTGLRYSDAFITPTDLRDGMIYKTLRKTKKYNISVNIPLNPISTSILEKYKNTIPKMEDYYFNKLIKEVCSVLPSLQSEETTVNYCGLKAITETAPKYRLLSSHSGRRSYVNILIDYNVPLVNIIALTGHTNLQQLQTYADSRRNLKKRLLNVFQLVPGENQLLINA